ncbi:MAG TPA: YciI family protein [Fimbriimonadaceae bacterium]|nr:YciI family protein [Fimbriimonadaceae bacterium]
MSEFALIYRGEDRPLSPEESQRLMANIRAWFDGLKEKGHIKDAGYPLDSAGGVVVGEDRTIFDGPYAEAKDVIGGFTLVEAKDLAEAFEIAKTCPILDVGKSVEVRPTRAFSHTE